MSFALQKALSARIVLLSGEEDALRTRALQEITTAATLEDDFDLEVMDAGESDPIQWSASAGTAPFLSTRRTVVVRHLLRKDLVDTSGWGQLPETALLVLVADDEGGDESKQSRFNTIRGHWEKAVVAVGGYVEAFKLAPGQVIESIRQEAVRQGKKMSPKAAETLAEMCGASLSRAIDELEKVSLFVGNAETITESDIRTVAMPSREYNVFKMVDAAFNGDGGEALRQLRILVGSATKAEDAAYQRILPTMHRQLRLIWQGRILLDNRADPENPPQSVIDLLPEGASIMKVPPFVKGKAIRAARKADFHQLTECLKIVSDADASLKGMLPQFTAMDTLERMILSMIEVLAGRQVAAR